MIITVASFKGGVGKSTTAIHLAAYFHSRGRTLLVDGDPNRSLTRWASHGKLPFMVVSEARATMHAKEHEHIIIDTKARPEESDLKELALGCHLLVLPCTPDPLAVDALVLTVDALKAIGTSKYRVLLTIVPPKPNKDGEKAREALVEAGLPLFAGEIRRTVAYQRCVLDGSTIDGGEYMGIGEEIAKLSKHLTD